MKRPRALPAILAALLLGLQAHSAAAAPTARELLARGDAARFAADWYGAVEAYLGALAANPGYGEAYLGLAEAYYELEEYDQALSYAGKAAPFLRGEPRLKTLEGFILIGLGDLAGARARFSGVLALLPNDLDARFGLVLVDLASGKKTEARTRLEDSLRLAPTDSRTLLSLALIASDQGRLADARSLADRALRDDGSDPRVQYAAARLAALEGDTARASFHARTALDLSPGFAAARRLLGSLLYAASSFDEAVTVMREAVARNRGDAAAWFTLGLAQKGAGKPADAIFSLRAALSLVPDDEIARMALEGLVMDTTALEDPAREAWADWHVRRGIELEDRSLYDQALFEYRRALRVYPYSRQGRFRFAELLRKRGWPARQLAELSVLEDQGKADAAVLDAIEIYDSLLADSVSRSWGVDQFSLPKRGYSVALFYSPAPGELGHTAADAVMMRYLGELLSSSSRLRVPPPGPAPAGAQEAFRRARESGADYYLLVRVRETEREIELVAELRVARTGSLATSFRSFRTGNDRVKNAVTRLAELLSASLEPRGAVLVRRQDKALVDLGRADGLAVGDRFLVLKRGGLDVLHEGLGPAYSATDLVGEWTVTRVDEEVAEGDLKRSGFFDAINAGDLVVRAPAPPAPPPAGAAGAAGAAKPAPAAGAPAAGKPPTPVAPLATEPEWPGLFISVRQLR